jgi:hypothetical protein
MMMGLRKIPITRFIRAPIQIQMTPFRYSRARLPDFMGSAVVEGSGMQGGNCGLLQFTATLERLGQIYPPEPNINALTSGVLGRT